MTLAGSLGAGKLLVLHPAFSGDPLGLDFALGVQRLIARRLKECGRATAITILRVRIEEVQVEGDVDAPWQVGDMMLGTVDAWAEDTLASVIAEQFGCRWGVVPEFHAEGGGCRLVTRLFEVDDDGRPQSIESWSFEGDNLLLPDHLVQLIDGIALRTGTPALWTNTRDLFGTDEPIPVLYYLRALGYCSQLEEDCRVDRRQVLATLCLALDGAPTMDALHELVPQIVHALARAGTTDLELAHWLRELRQRAGANAWPGLLDDARAARDRLD